MATEDPTPKRMTKGQKLRLQRIDNQLAKIGKRVLMDQTGIPFVPHEKEFWTVCRLCKALGHSNPPSHRAARVMLICAGRKASPEIIEWASKDFYRSDEWRAARYDALKRSGRKCLVCGGSPETGAVLHVDHIQPRSRRPDLELDPNNLQVLCGDCNLGKGARDSIDWRKP